MSLLYPQVRDDFGRLLWKMREATGQYRVTTEYVKGCRPFTVKDKERLDNPPRRKKPTKKRKTDPFRFVGNKYLMQLYWAGIKITQSAEAQGIPKDVVLSMLVASVHDDNSTLTHCCHKERAVVIYHISNLPYVVLCFGLTNPAVKFTGNGEVPRSMAPYVKNNCLNRWVDNIKDTSLDQGCYTFILPHDILWGLLQTRLEPLPDWATPSEEPISGRPKPDRNEIYAIEPAASVPVVF